MALWYGPMISLWYRLKKFCRHSYESTFTFTVEESIEWTCLTGPLMTTKWYSFGLCGFYGNFKVLNQITFFVLVITIDLSTNVYKPSHHKEFKIDNIQCKCGIYRTTNPHRRPHVRYHRASQSGNTRQGHIIVNPHVVMHYVPNMPSCDNMPNRWLGWNLHDS